VSAGVPQLEGSQLTILASIVPYKAFETADGDILLGGGNDRLYGVLCERIGKPEWANDDRFVSNNLRVKHRDLLESMIETETRKRTTREWLEILEGCGMPYAAINDVQGSLNHEHSTNQPIKYERKNRLIDLQQLLGTW